MKVGKIHTDKFGNRLEFITELPKSHWRRDYSLNYSVTKVYGVLFNDTKIQVAYHNKTQAFTSFVNECNKTFHTHNFRINDGDFDEMVVYGYESENGKTGKNIHYTNGVCEFEIYGGVEICIVPWNDGVMLQTILIPNEHRNKGLGKFIMDMLEGISAETDTPIYLIAYPSESFNPIEEKVLVSRLEKFYKKSMYDLALEHGSKIWPKVLCNME
jgi:hypothetical protein